MATASPRTVSVPASTPRVYAGRIAPSAPQLLESVTEIRAGGANGPLSTLGQMLIITLHGSNNDLSALTTTRIMRATLNNTLPGGAYSTDTTFTWHESNAGTVNGRQCMRVFPADRQPPNGVTNRESDWMGWTIPEDGRLHLFTQRRLDALVARYMTDPRINPAWIVIEGGSMGAFGAANYGVRRPSLFAATFPDRPRWRNAVVAGTVSIHDWVQPITQVYSVGSAPLLAAEDGGGSAATFMDITTYLGSAAAVPFVGWVCGRLDGNAPFQDQIDAVAAFRARGLPFVFLWNNGNHSSAPSMFSILNSYPYSAFQRGRGVPVFSEHSLDQDPSVDLVGSINQNLSFRNVVETTSTWQCQVTNIAAACTVKVKPYSSVYTGSPTPQLVTIPAANSWVTVSF